MTQSHPSQDSTPKTSLASEQCRQQLRQPDLSHEESVRLLCQQGHLLTELGRYETALASYDQALELKPDDFTAHHQRAQVLERLGNYKAALAEYDRAIALNPMDSAQVWVDRGQVFRLQGNFKEAIASYDKAAAMQPENYRAWAGRGYVLSILGRHQDALASCNRAMELEPNAAEVWNVRGIALYDTKRYTEALAHFDRAIELQPEFDRAWNNRGLVLLYGLEHYQEALTSYEHTLALLSSHHESWHAMAWTNHGHALLKLGRHQEAIASFEIAQDLQRTIRDMDDVPLLNRTKLSIAMFKLFSLFVTGRILAYAIQPGTRGRLLTDVMTILGSFKYYLLALVCLVLVLGSQATWAPMVQQAISILFSVGFVTLMAVELWKSRSKLNLVWTVYFRSGILTYVRAFGILVATLTTFAVTSLFAPSFMYLGWANLVFGQSGNIVFQPLSMLAQTPPPSPRPSPFSSTSGKIAGPSLDDVNPGNPDVAPIPDAPLTDSPLADSSMVHHPLWDTLSSIDYALLLIIILWIGLILLLPFWAQFEERIFRQGANNWRQITIRSIQFGLIHLVAGIPLIGGIVLILPGFLFACRYKYVRDRHLKRTHHASYAEDAGVAASTADHAVYNAILITFVVASLLLNRVMG